MTDNCCKAVDWLLKHQYYWEGKIDGRIELLINNAPACVIEYANNQNSFCSEKPARKFDLDTDSKFYDNDISNKAALDYYEARTLGIW